MDRMHGLGAFVRAVEAGSFTAGARLLETTPSAISKSIARLERRLKVRLFHRSTRSLALTEEGQAYYDRIAPLVHAIEDASGMVGEQSSNGRIKVTMPAELGRALLEPITRVFLPCHPRMRLEANLSDRRVDLIHEGYDVAIRAGTPPDTELTARLLGTLELVLVAAPAYLDRVGTPNTLTDLQRHTHVRYRLGGLPYPVRSAWGPTVALPAGAFDADDGEALRIAAVNGLGITQILHRSVSHDLASGRLRRVLSDVPLATVPVYALHAYARLAPERLQVFLDFVADTLRAWDSRSVPDNDR
ncbi:LysR family transcriptional regulator [Methylobacterium gregans]|uniref:HTH-type transcriptional regulator DmlR n=1 Tax=Methylobacterium gregans TaxID=374424 RepID=A0AA37MAG5_9HYPH|nr:LysR family transcriptional regulator [Methylobacterium gregans]MDQ0521295.1 DNA-binding transcriptional LysR family regulator [Methylobacterium gregans]GJD78452.1 HTH-type transcriptional regulator DmlR [Methylobacterium gregans]GLS54458.1 LysR family transcriptional regulator [Methylobacterium gregans]